MNKKSPARSAFTLVELLVVMAIIGVLVGLLLAALGPVRTAARVMQQGTEIANLKRAIDAYREKVGDYPPDFADYLDSSGAPQKPFTATVAYKHVTKFYSNIAPEELVALKAKADSNYFNHATVLTFFLGGLSDDSKYPFTGPGGPLNGVTDRNDPLMDFDVKRVLNGVYFPQNSKAPFVYFDARTYDFVDATGNRVFAHFDWTSPDAASTARPYKSTEVNPANATQPADKYFHYVNRESYQVISPGLDDNFGLPLPPTDDGTGTLVPVFIIFPQMLPFHPVLYDASMVLSGGAVPPAIALYAEGHKDNITNFSGGGKLEDRKP